MDQITLALLLTLASGADEAAFDQVFEELSVLESVMQTQVEVTSGRPADVFSAPSAVSVIDRRTIERYGFTRVSQALTTLAGVSVLRTHLKQGSPTVRGILQDHYANKVLVLIDGVPAWMAVTGEGNLDRIDIRDLERIEVLKGPASVLYGTNAYSGAINLVLRRPTAGEGQVRGEAGNLRHFGLGGAAGYSGDNLTVFAAATGLDERGAQHSFLDETARAGSMREYFKNQNATVRATYKGLGGSHSLLLNAFSQHESSFGVVPTWAEGVGKDHYLNGYLGNYEFRRPLGETADVRAGVTVDWQQRDLPRSDDDRLRSGIYGYRTQGLVQGHWAPWRWLELELGGDFEYRRSEAYDIHDTVADRVTADNNMAGRSVYEWSVLGQAHLNTEPLLSKLPLHLVVGLRYTGNQYSDQGLSLRGTAAWAFSERSSLKFIAAQSFRAPTLFELDFATPNRTVIGNANLEPERSNSFELVWLGAIERLFAQASLYYATYENKIFRVRANPDDPADKALKYVNGGQFKGWGGELELRHEDPRFVDGFLSYAYQHGDSGDRLPGTDHYNFKYVPEHTAALGLSRALGPVTVGTVLRFLSDRGGPQHLIPWAITWDASVALKLGPTTHRLLAQNLLNDDPLVAEFVRRNVNSLPSGLDRRIFYTFTWTP